MASAFTIGRSNQPSTGAVGGNAGVAAPGGEAAQQSAPNVFALDTKHEDNINDCQFDFYGTQIASCDSKGFLQISSVRTDGEQEPQTTFQAHEGPIWQVSWAHPKYESVIATGGYDHFLRVWKRDHNNNWNESNKVYEANLQSSVNCVAWAPWEYGLLLAAGTAEGLLYVFMRTHDDQWVRLKKIVAHQSGVNGISWGPATEPAILAPDNSASAGAGGKFQPPPKRLVTGGNDNMVKMWLIRDGEQDAEETQVG